MDINNDNFKSEVLGHKGTVIVDFYGSWCMPCRMLAPTLEKVCSEHNIKLAKVDIDENRALELYDHYMKITTELMYNKNSDYDEAWRYMRVNSYTDIILTKLERIKQIEDNNGETIVSEGVDANFMDIVNYSLFGLIQLGNDR